MIRYRVLLSVCLVLGCKEEPKYIPTHKGLFVYGNQLNSFTPCNEDRMYWVEGRAAKQIQARHGTMTRRPFQPIYVEIQGRVLPPSNQYPMEAHDGSIRIDTVLTAQIIRPKDCKIVGGEGLP